MAEPIFFDFAWYPIETTSPIHIIKDWPKKSTSGVDTINSSTLSSDYSELPAGDIGSDAAETSKHLHCRRLSASPMLRWLRGSSSSTSLTSAHDRVCFRHGGGLWSVLFAGGHSFGWPHCLYGKTQVSRRAYVNAWVVFFVVQGRFVDPACCQPHVVKQRSRADNGFFCD